MKTAIQLYLGKFAGLGVLMAALAAVPADIRDGLPIKMVRSQPVAGCTVAETYQVDLHFDRVLRRNLNQVWVYPEQEMQMPKESRTSLVRGSPYLNFRDQKHLMAEVMPLPPGHYFVMWDVTGIDQGKGIGQIDFRVPEPPVRAVAANPAAVR